MSEPLSLLFHQIEPPRDVEAIKQYVTLFQTEGYSIHAVGVFRELSSPKLEFHQSVDDALPAAQQRENIHFRAEHPENRLSLGVYIHWSFAESEDSSLWLACDQLLLFSDGLDENPAYTAVYYWRHLLDLGKQLYAITRPRFGWIDHSEPGASPSNEEIADFRVFDHIRSQLGDVYWANFFSPDFVARIGRDRLTNPPIGWSEALADGGMVYVIGSLPFDNVVKYEDRQKLIQYLGI